MVRQYGETNGYKRAALLAQSARSTPEIVRDYIGPSLMLEKVSIGSPQHLGYDARRASIIEKNTHTGFGGYQIKIWVPGEEERNYLLFEDVDPELTIVGASVQDPTPSPDDVLDDLLAQTSLVEVEKIPFTLKNTVRRILVG